jgi:GLPGLI family protein
MKIQIFTLLFTLLSFSQNKIEIKYDVKEIKDAELEKQFANDAYMTEYLNKMGKIIEQMKPVIEITNSTATYKLPNKSDFDKGFGSEKAALVYIKAVEDIYYDLSKNYTYQFANADNFFKKKEYFIQKECFNSWEISGETKDISGVKCVKATYVIDNIKKMGKDNPYARQNPTSLVTAWFASEMPYAVGPAGYCGLPGVILELQTKDFYFTASSITFDRENKDSIEIPQADKIISEEEFLKIFENKREEVLGKPKTK